MRSILSVRARRVATTVATASAAFLLGSIPAQAAGKTTVVYTDDGGSTRAGKAIFWGGYDQEAFKVCDTESDGLRVWAQFEWKGGSVMLSDADGSSNFCDNKPSHNARKQVPEGATVKITVCRRDGDRGKLQDCGYDEGKA